MQHLAFGTPSKIPKASSLDGRVVVFDIAFAGAGTGGGFKKITLPLIDGLGDRLGMWVDHHDSEEHVLYKDDPRFVLATKAEHGACPEMITPELVARAGRIDTIVCHTDFDGLASAAKWIRAGVEPYPGCDDDARAIDTRIGTPSPVAERIDRALRARFRDQGLFGVIVRHMATGLADSALWQPIDEAAAETGAIVTAEEHHLVGGLGGAVADLLALEQPTRMRMVGMPDVFASIGPTNALRAKYGMSAEGIAGACREILRVLGR